MEFSETQIVPLLILGNPIYRVLGNLYAAGPMLMALGPGHSEFVQRVADKGSSRKPTPYKH